MKPFKYFLLLFSLGLFFNATQAQTFTKLNNPVINAHTGDWFVVSPIDYDNDYLIDLITAGNGSEGTFKQTDSLSFQFSASTNFISVTGNTAISSSWADVDNDCDLDVFWPKIDGSAINYFYENNGDGTFSRITSGALITDNIKARDASWGDFDNDGLVDLFLARTNSISSGQPNWLYKNNGNFSFSKIDTGVIALKSDPTSMGSWVDIDNDNDLDLFVLNRANIENELFINDGSGHFAENDSSTLTNLSKNSIGCSWGDFNNDGFQDVFVVNVLGGKNGLHINNGDETFTQITTGDIVNDLLNSIGSAWADFDNDGLLDLFVGNNSNTWPRNNLLYRNNGDSTFTKITSGPQYTDWDETWGVAGTDLNHDGAVDIVTSTRWNKSIKIYMNDGNTNGFANFTLKGSASNRSAIGTRLVIKSTLGKQTRTVSTSSGSYAQDNFSLHFGLGQDTIIDSLWVYWPSGNTCTLSNVSINQFYNLDESGCSLDTATDASFIASSSFLNATFSNQSVGSISSYLWDFGDGDTSTVANPNHRYVAPGKYQVTLTAYDNYCKHRVYKDSIEICPDTSILNFSTAQTGNTVSFTNISNSAAYGYSWDFGDGTNSSGSATSHTYINAGSYTVCMTATDSCRSKTFCKNITLCGDTLLAGFSHSNQAFSVAFTDTSANVNGVLWDFGDGNTSQLSNPTHNYAMAGIYWVCQTAFGLCDTTTTCDSINVCLDSLIADFNFSINGNLVSFSNQSTGALSYQWNFGDGNQSSGENPINFFANDTVYTVCLIVDNVCTTDTVCKTINLCSGTGTAGFNSTLMPNIVLGVQFSSTSTNAVSYLWDFGDGSSSTLRDPIKIYNSSNTYTVCHSIVDSCGNIDSTCQSVLVGIQSIAELQFLNTIELFPNPTSSNLIIKQTSPKAEVIEVKFVDLTGKTLEQFTITDTRYELNLDALSKGVYLLQLNFNGYLRTERILKQ
jgi:PKD repeat protein